MTPEPEVLETTMDENPLLDFLLADLAWGKRPRNSPEIPDSSTGPTAAATWHGIQMIPDERVPPGTMVMVGREIVPVVNVETADEAFAREIELAREVCEDAEVDALTQPVPTATLPFGGDGGSRE